MTDTQQRQSIEGGGRFICKATWGDAQGLVPPDVDLQAVCFTDRGVVCDIAYWNNERACGGAVRHGGDGSRDFGAEDLVVDLAELPLEVASVSFTISSYVRDMPLARVNDVVISFEHVGGSGPALHWTLFPQFNELACRPGLVACAGHLARMGKSSFEAVRYGDGLQVIGETFVQAIPMVRDLARLPAPPAGEPFLRVPVRIEKGQSACVYKGVAESMATSPEELRAAGRFVAGIGWDVANPGCEPSDVDLSLVALDSSFNVVHRVFWGELEGFGGAIIHCGDNETGEDTDGRVGGDDEWIDIDLTKLPDRVAALVFLVCNYGAKSLSHVSRLHFHLSTRDAHQRHVPVVTIDARTHAEWCDAAGYAPALLRRGTDGDRSWHVAALAASISGDSVLDPVTTAALVNAAREGAAHAVPPQNLRGTLDVPFYPGRSTQPQPHSSTFDPVLKPSAAKAEHVRAPAEMARTAQHADQITVSAKEYYTQALVTVFVAALLWYLLKYMRLV